MQRFVPPHSTPCTTTTQVVLAASVCTKGGKPVIARQFIEMSRSRIEGLLASFPKLLHSVKTAPALSATTAYPQYNASSTGGGASSSSQQTYVETEAVRYIYQPLDDLYLVLVTTKHSNILQDIDTLALFARTVVEYVRGVAVRESEVLRNAYELLVAFDEIVGVEGLREGVTVAAVRAVTEMDSHEERLQEIMQKVPSGGGSCSVVYHTSSSPPLCIS